MKMIGKHVIAVLLGLCVSDEGRFGFCSAFRPATTSHKPLSIRRAPCVCRCVQKDESLFEDNFQSDLDALIKDQNRRRAMQVAVGILVAAGLKQEVTDAAPLEIDTITAPSSELEPGLLDSRVTENLMSAPPYGMEGPDIFYPSWFAGTWKVASTTADVQAPVGVVLFGGNRTFESAQREVGTTLQYESRFITATGVRGNTTIADREYNVRSIAQAAMGPKTVLDVPLVSPNKLTCILAPVGSPSVLQATLLTLNRRQETISDNKFDCSEVVLEIVAPASGGPNSSNTMIPRILKQVETTSLYTYDPKRDTITCRQRSAAFLLPSQQDPVALKMWQASRGRPVDVRFYDVVYTRR